MSSKRAGPWGIIWRSIFAAPFILVGLASLGSGIVHLQPSAAVFGLIFAGAGVLVVYTGVREMRSAEALGKIMPGAITAAPVGPAAFGGYRANAGPRAPTARELYGAQLPHLPVADLVARRGRTLPYALGRRDPYGGWVLLAVSVFWNGVSVPLFVGALTSRSAGALFFLLFVLVGILMFVTAVKRVLALRKVVALEVGAEPAYLGDALTVHLAQRGPIRITRLVMALVCKEYVVYRVGTTSRREDREVFREELCDEIGLTVSRGETWTRQLDVTLPAGPASFRAPNNEVAWSIAVKAEIDGWPDYDEMFVFRALPKVIA